MTRKKNEKFGHSAIDQEILDELFPDRDNGPEFAIDEPGALAIGRIIAAVTALGGMATFYRNRDDHSFRVSLRFGDKSKSYALYGDDGDLVTLEHAANFYEGAWAKRGGGIKKL